MKKSPLRRVGRVGRANIEANKILREKLGHIEYCEMKLEGCLGNWLLQFAHRHKRLYYKGDVEKLSDTNEVVVACQNCHQKTEFNRELNDQVFNRLRGDAQS